MQTVWKGAVSFGLVNVPVKMFTATQDHDISLRMLHKDYLVPIQYHRTCPKCGENVSWKDIVKGFEYEPGKYVTFEKDELEKLASETSREIRILDFIELSEIDPIYFQKTYYLAPEETGRHAYGLLVKAMKKTNKIGIANITLRSKSSLAAVRVTDDDVLSVVTMYYEEEIRPVEEIPNMPGSMKVDERELDMAETLIDQLTARFDPGRYKDEYRERLMEAIEDKVEGKDVKYAPEEKPTNVIDLMEALKASLKQSKPEEKRKEGGEGAKETAKKEKKRSASSGRKKPAGKRASAKADDKAESGKTKPKRTRKTGS